MNIDDLKKLRVQLDQAIKIIEEGLLKEMSEEEKRYYDIPKDTMIVGDYVIQPREIFEPWENLVCET